MNHALSPALPRAPYDAELQTELGSIGWQGRLDECADAHDVVQTVKDYLARLEPEEIAPLPPHCWPSRIVDADDVAEYALQLARAQCDAEGELVDKLSGFMTNASLRLAQILRSAANEESRD